MARVVDAGEREIGGLADHSADVACIGNDGRVTRTVEAGEI